MHPEPMTPMEWCHFCKSSPSAGERGCPEARDSRSGLFLQDSTGGHSLNPKELLIIRQVEKYISTPRTRLRQG